MGVRVPDSLRATRRASCVLLVALVSLGCPESTSSQTRRAGAAAARDNGVRAQPSLAEVLADTLPRDSIAELPRATVDVKYVAPTGRAIRVESRGNLQSAFNRASAGDVILLARGATFTGNFELPSKPCGAGWITVRTDIADDSLPGEGERITPAYAGRLAAIATPNQAPAVKTENPTCGWRFVGVEITTNYPSRGGPPINYGIVWLGDGGWEGGGETQRSYESVPADIVLDRVYLHGRATTNTMRCLSLNSARSAVVNSWLSDCHAKGFDSQAIVGWNGPGPYLIENNYLEGAGENVMFGGADPRVPNLVPSDITIRRNHFYKNPAWKGAWTVKNLFELKSARRVLVEGNVFENNWADAQSGMAIVIKSSNDEGTAPWQGTTDVTFRYNVVRNSPRGFNAQAVDGNTGVHVARVRVEHNLFENIGSFNGTGQDGWHLLLTHDLRDVSFVHNTFVNNTTFGTAIVMDYADGRARRLTFTDNVFTSPGGFAIFYSGKRVGTESLRAMAGNSWTFVRNVVAGVSPEFAPWHPPQNWYPHAIGGIGFVDPVVSDYRLRATSPYKIRGQGGTDPGVHLARMREATKGVVVRVP